jgi:hypothetical protein
VAGLAKIGEDEGSAFDGRTIGSLKRVGVGERLPSSRNRAGHRRFERHPIAEIRILLECVVPRGANHIGKAPARVDLPLPEKLRLAGRVRRVLPPDE